MIFTFLLGLAAGALTPVVEPFVKQALEGVALSKVQIERSEMDLLTLVILLIVAALLTGGGSSIALLVGALVGIFGKRIITAIKGQGPTTGGDAP